MKFKAEVVYSLNTHKVESGMEVPYKQYRENCQANRVIPVASYLYPCHEYKKHSKEYVVEAESVTIAARKIHAHPSFRRIFGAKAEFNRCSTHPDFGYYTITSENQDLGWYARLSIQPFPPEQQEKVIHIE